MACSLTLRLLSDFPDSPDTRRRLYLLVRQGVLDSPGSDGDFPSLEDFNAFIFGPSYWAEADTQVLALDGEAWVGLSSLRRTSQPGVSGFGLTTVDRSYRGRGVALALKRRALERAAARGDHRVTTEVHPDNAAMRAVNARLGFARVPDLQPLERA
ncbi:GNAT family N-acetyltransferase (plasmid) [Deinococcus taeanensis]|uniref:GNAT family N-acetyltransferase n=1 Tax=Deinococcus taeanensis TaxID=2737050 RepID=UPI001CDD5EE3|nr:GNAT family protein [Deinococcus taeanensis]UBV45284.1 GNAT family N-acetyltransferase [Deinococcus taeanensis]